MKALMLVVFFFQGVPDANIAPFESMAECERTLEAAVQQIMKNPRITQYVISCSPVVEKA